MDALATLWANARVAHLLAMHRMVPAEVEDDGKDGYDTSREGFVMHTQKVETLGPFSSHIIPVKMMEAYLGECLNVMMQSMHVQDGTLPPSLTVQNMYTELRKGSKKAVAVVRNQTTYPQTLWKKIPVARMIPVQLVPEAHESDVLPD